MCFFFYAPSLESVLGFRHNPVVRELSPLTCLICPQLNPPPPTLLSALSSEIERVKIELLFLDVSVTVTMPFIIECDANVANVGDSSFFLCVCGVHRRAG